ncbi:MAG: helix-turn-helix domain-containing protein [Clostridia bacterium]|nr:helix-turn-helix domain-containing protein [Clostridia bacterium]
MSDFVPTTLKQEIEIESLVTLHYFEHAKNYVFTGERHDFWELVYVDKGRLEVVAENNGYELQQGQMIFHQPNEFHNLFANGTIAPNVVIFTFVCHSPAMSFFKRKIAYATQQQRDLIAQIVREGRKAFTGPLGDPYTVQMVRADDPPFGCEQMVRLLLEMLLIDMIRHDKTTEQRPKSSSSIKQRSDCDLVARVIRFMEEHLCDSLSFSEICQFSAQSATNLKTIFKSVTGSGVMEYYRELKIEQAKILLREGNGNITQIADRLGYSSVHYFSRHFKQATGMTPREYTLSVQAT